MSRPRRNPWSTQSYQQDRRAAGCRHDRPWPASSGALPTIHEYAARTRPQWTPTTDSGNAADHVRQGRSGDLGSVWPACCSFRGRASGIRPGCGRPYRRLPWHRTQEDTLAPLSTVTLREITERDRGVIEELAVTAEQSYYVASVAEAWADAAGQPDGRARHRAVSVRQEPVGFVMISDGITVTNADYLGPYSLGRLTLARRSQGCGYATRALDLGVPHARTRPDARVLITSHGVGPASPRG